ncbi:hypothetical protein UFOVP212_38 [uncultured Caudovirales phage]|uniref:YqaJ viral recombinase domain-containing protein n=1 Tax=uncultured Caudovirales phage TaxID=2100421 RepID=A0A6J7WK83_9CAUD|nr:hypothetical protein UFOVP212_38 [uncultured Caudovirales phage]
MIQTRFSASRISELLAGGTGKTAQSYILDLAMQSIGLREEFTTPAMTHGIQNQMNGFEKVVKPLFPNAEWHDEFILINEYCGASPDIINDSSPMDIKCPYYIDTFIEQINKPPSKYFAQVQMQMMACKSDIGRLVFYLTKSEEWGQETEVVEYPFPLELRFKIFEFTKDEEIQEKILEKVEESQPKKIQMIELLNGATLISEEQFFYEQMNGFVYRKLQESNNILNLASVIRVNDKFYYKK